MLYLKDDKIYVRSGNGYREADLFVEEGAFGFKAKGDIVNLGDDLPAYNIEELIAKFHVESEEHADGMRIEGNEDPGKEAGIKKARSKKTGK